MGIEVIARDWDRADWCGGFYPEDLPEEWRLAYFANAFDAVLVPAAAWQGDPSRLALWAQEVPHRFRFYLELPRGSDPRAMAQAAAPLGERFAGSVAVLPPRTEAMPGASAPPGDGPASREAGPRSDEPAADWPLADGPTGTGAGPDGGPEPAAQPDRTLAAWAADGGTILARQIPQAVVADPRAALAWLTALAAEAGSKPALAIFGDAPADTLTRWSQLILLAGFA
jgi:hypothetical protein